MKFIDRIDSYLSLINEQDPGAEAAPTADATAPDPSASQPAATGTQGVHVQDEGYVDLVKLLVKATAMNFPIGALDQLYQTDVTKENAFTVRDAVKDALTMYEGDGDNMTRLDNPNYKTFVDSINKNNLYLKLDKIKSIINSRA